MTGNRPQHGLDGRTWIRYSISVWNDIKKTREETPLKHPAMFPVHLCRRLIRIFTGPGDLVLDPFAGSGSALLAAAEEGRRALGLEISQDYVDLARSRLPAGNDAKIIRADARRLGELVEEESVGLCITSPPYWDILSRRRSADHRGIRDYQSAEDNLSGIDSYPEFIEVLSGILAQVKNLLLPGRFMAVVVMDIRRGPEFYPLHMDLASSLTNHGLKLEDIIIWDRRADYNNLRPLGYPYVFRVNKIHEYILLFSRPAAS